jgi:hypothetical protein
MYRPWVGRHFGVEMEMNDVTTTHLRITERQIRQALEGAARLPVSGQAASYHHSNGAAWEIKTDGSCGVGGRSGWEIASPKLMLDESGRCEELENVCKAIARLKPSVNRQCGLHVTVDVSDFSWRNMRDLLTLWSRYEPYVFELCPPTRRANRYCPPIRKARWEDTDATHWSTIEGLLGNSENPREPRLEQRYCFPRGSLNLTNWWSGRRIEFRLQAGTVNHEKITRWTQFVLSFVARVRQAAPFPQIVSGGWSNRGFSTTYVFKVLGLAPSHFLPAEQVPPESVALMQWAEARRRQFMPETQVAASGVASAAGRSRP